MVRLLENHRWGKKSIRTSRVNSITIMHHSHMQSSNKMQHFVQSKTEKGGQTFHISYLFYSKAKLLIIISIISRGCHKAMSLLCLIIFLFFFPLPLFLNIWETLWLTIGISCTGSAGFINKDTGRAQKTVAHTHHIPNISAKLPN